MFTKLLPSSVALLMLGALQAQPVLTAEENFLSIGDSVTIVTVQQPFDDPGPAGANVTWDFSDAQADEEIGTFVPIALEEAPFQDSFPNSTNAITSSYGSGTADSSSTWSYYTYDQSAGQIFFDGSAFIGGDPLDTFFLIYQDNQLLFDFPLTYGDTYEDTYGGESFVDFGGIMAVQGRSCTTSTEVDGYGTLITPAGQFENVLRLKTAETCRDSFSLAPTFVTIQTATRYSWLAQGEKYFLFSLDLVSISTPGLPITNSVSASYRGSGPILNTNEAAFAERIGLRISPNPALEDVTVRFNLEENTSFEIMIMNSLGQIIKRFPARAAGAGAQNHELSVAGIPAGHYALVIRSAAGTAAQLLAIR